MDNNFYPKRKMSKKWIFNIVVIIGFFIIFVYYFLTAPFENKDVVVHISSGQSISYISKDLKNKNVIRDDFTLKMFIRLLKSDRGVISGDYLFKKNSLVWVVAWQLGTGNHKIEPVKITIREGLTNLQIASLLANKLTAFRKDLFLLSVENKQGYLFPDTYFFFPLDTNDEIVEKLSNNFENRTKKLNLAIITSGKTLSDVIIMASILEGEAGGEKDVEIISGILWKRISVDMPLQIDIDKSTYIKKGLPLVPLNNPGLISINAAIKPIDSTYLYYLHDKNGKVHYAVNFLEHKRNINNYLK